MNDRNHYFFNHPTTTNIYTLSLHDALPICLYYATFVGGNGGTRCCALFARSSPENRPVSRLSRARAETRDRKSTRLNSSHVEISYAVFCLKKKKNTRE